MIDCTEKLNPDIVLIAAIPFAGQELYSLYDKHRYKRIYAPRPSRIHYR